MALLSSALVVIRPSFLIAGALVAAGTVGAHTTTQALRTNVAALDFRGSDAAYALAGAALTHAVGSVLGFGRVTRPVALGMVASGALAAKQEFVD